MRFASYFLVFLAVVVAPGSSRGLAEGDAGAGPDRTAVVFLPGYLGSFLRDTTTKKRVYVTVGSVLWGPGAVSLYQKELSTPAGPEVEPDGVMDFVPAVLSNVDVYGSLLADLKAMPNTDVFPFDWDWRKDPYAAVVQLGALVDSLRSQGYAHIDFVGHSAGGWLATYYLAYGTQDPATAHADWSGAKNIRRAALLGTPFEGGMPLFRELSRGSSLPMMSHLLPADTLASFPSIYCTAPLAAGHFLDGDGKPRGDVALADPAVWQNYHFGLLARTDLPAPVMAARQAHVTDGLASCGRFLSLIQLAGAPAAPDSLSLLSLVGTKTKTMDKAFLVDKDGQAQVLFDVDNPQDQGYDTSLMFTEGDGTVPVASSLLPAVLSARAQRVEVGVTHEKLTTDTDSKAAILTFLGQGNHYP